MTGLEKFLAMGGYAAYVWPAVALTAIVLGAFWITSWRAARDADAALKRMEDSIDGEES